MAGDEVGRPHRGGGEGGGDVAVGDRIAVLLWPVGVQGAAGESDQMPDSYIAEVDAHVQGPGAIRRSGRGCDILACGFRP